MFNFEKLIVWQKSIEVAVVLVQIADSLPQKYQYSFSDQLRRAALSIPSNIAEGSGRKGKRDQANFYSISKGSSYEAVNIIKLLDKLNAIDNKRFKVKQIYKILEEVVKMLHKMSNS